MKAPAFTYHRPQTLHEAVQLLADLGDDAKILGGGQSLLPIMNMRLAEPANLVDVTGVRALRGATARDGGVRYGATTTHGMFEDQLVPDASGGLLQHAAARIGYRAIRNRGTVGGSLAHADSSAEWPTVMSAVDASVEATSVRGTRRIPVRQLLQGFFTTSLEPDEVLSAVLVPALPDERWWGLYKSARKVGEFANSLAVTLVDVAADGRISHVELWLGAARDVPVRLHATELAVLDHRVDEITISELVPAIARDIARPTDEPDPLARHALQLHAVAVRRALNNARRGSR
jgi:carbon-monoxide dehydrogenase medium subunit